VVKPYESGAGTQLGLERGPLLLPQLSRRAQLGLEVKPAPFASTEPEGTARARGAAPFRVLRPFLTFACMGEQFHTLYKLASAQFGRPLGLKSGTVLVLAGRSNRFRLPSCSLSPQPSLPEFYWGSTAETKSTVYEPSHEFRGVFFRAAPLPHHAGRFATRGASQFPTAFLAVNSSRHVDLGTAGRTRTDSLHPLLPPCQPLRGGRTLPIPRDSPTPYLKNTLLTLKISDFCKNLVAGHQFPVATTGPPIIASMIHVHARSRVAREA
jgi:hypothetical protein